MKLAAYPYREYRVVVPTEWIDVNGHMNATRYGLVVYDAHVMFTEAIGLGDDYVRHSNCGKAVVESHMIYEREVSMGHELAVRSWLLAVDHKRLHFFHEVLNLSTNTRAAAAEQIDLHIDLAARKSSSMPIGIYENLQAIVVECLQHPLPAGVGSQLKPPRNLFTINPQHLP